LEIIAVCGHPRVARASSYKFPTGGADLSAYILKAKRPEIDSFLKGKSSHFEKARSNNIKRLGEPFLKCPDILSGYWKNAPDFGLRTPRFRTRVRFLSLVASAQAVRLEKRSRPLG
jgi:hypothetical protein